MCAGNTNLSFEQSNLKILLNKVSVELIKVNEPFSENKLSLNVHKSGKKRSTPSVMSFFVITVTLCNI